MRSFVSVASLALYAVITPAQPQTGAAADMILRPHDKDAVALTPDPQAVPRQDRLASRGGEHALRYLAGF
jgi:hypothetical protein